MKKIAYYISEYGYGHASRSIALIRYLLKRDNDIEIIICHSFALTFIKDSLRSERVHYRNIKTDIGYYLKKDSLEPDIEKLNFEYGKFINEMNEKIIQEDQFLLKNKVDLVLSDISPIAFAAAEKHRIPSIGISNFTWYTAYKGLIDESLLSVFKEAYQKMTYLFSLAGSYEEEISSVTKKCKFSFFSRTIEMDEVKRIKKFVNPEENKKIIFVGLGMKVGGFLVKDLPLWETEDAVFLVSSNIEIKRKNVYQIPKDYTESQNYVAASDLLISKPGWGMIGEAVMADIPFLLIDRKLFKEDQNTIHYLKTHHFIYKLIKWEDIRNLKLEDLQNLLSKKSGRKKVSAADEIGKKIISVLNGENDVNGHQ